MENQPTDQQLALAKAALIDAQAATLAEARDACKHSISDLADALGQISQHRQLLERAKDLLGSDHPSYLEACDRSIAYFVAFAVHSTRLAGAEHSLKVLEMARALADFDMTEAGRKAYTNRTMRFLSAMAKWQSTPFRGLVRLTNRVL